MCMYINKRYDAIIYHLKYIYSPYMNLACAVISVMVPINIEWNEGNYSCTDMVGNSIKLNEINKYDMMK